MSETPTMDPSLLHRWHCAGPMITRASVAIESIQVQPTSDDGKLLIIQRPGKALLHIPVSAEAASHLGRLLLAEAS